MPPAIDLISILAEHAIPEPNLTMPLRIVGLDPRETTLTRRHALYSSALNTKLRVIMASALELSADSEVGDVEGEIFCGPVGIGVRSAPAAGERGNRTSQGAPGADAVAPVCRRVVPLAA